MFFSPLTLSSRPGSFSTISTIATSYLPGFNPCSHRNAMMDCSTGLEEFMYLPRLSQSFIFSDCWATTQDLTSAAPLSPSFQRALGSMSGTALPFTDEQDLDRFYSYSFSFHNYIDTTLPLTPTICPLESPLKEEPTIYLQDLFLQEDKCHVWAEDALKARRSNVTTIAESIPPHVVVKQEPHTEILCSEVKESSFKRTLTTASAGPVKPEVEIVNLSGSVRNVAPLPKKAISGTPIDISSKKPGHYCPFTAPRQPKSFDSSPLSSSSSTSASSSATFTSTTASSSSHHDSDYEPDNNNDDNDYLPDETRLKKRQKHGSSHTHIHKSRSHNRTKPKRTQLQIVLDDLPYTMADIVFSDGHYHCPFPNCFQATTSEGDLGRHLESSAHATHRYVCLSVVCLEQFAREDSMKRHHANNRGRFHKAEHDRTVKQGFPFRVRISQASGLKENVLAWARAEGRL